MNFLMLYNLILYIDVEARAVALVFILTNNFAYSQWYFF
jgi:hypothetical protein